MNKIIDFAINIVRWPIAIFMLFSIPALLQTYQLFNFYNLKYYLLGSGIIFYFATIIFGGYTTRHSMQIIAHELTHTLFAYLTLHKVSKVRLNPDGSGGSMQLSGYGNWLITLSPYFFPLFAFFYMLLMPSLTEATDHNFILYCILGYFLAYYWSTVLSQTHLGQTDIISEGYLFSFIIITAGNLYVTGIILAFTNKLWTGAYNFISLVHKTNIENFNTIEKLITQYF